MEAFRCVAALRLSSFPSQTLCAKVPRRITKESPSVLRVSCDSSAESTLSRSPARKSSEADTWQDVERRSPFLERETTGFVSNSVYLADTTTLLPGSHTPLDDEDDFGHDFAEDERLTRIGESVDTWQDRKVGEFMTPNPLCFRKETSLCAAAKALLRYRLTGAPVVEPLEGDAAGMGRLVGVLSQRDLLWKQRKPFPSVSHVLSPFISGNASPLLSVRPLLSSCSLSPFPTPPRCPFPAPTPPSPLVKFFLLLISLLPS
ncbi:unnamed protein product [Closterium sp. NIES-54]